jgi:protein gp37
VKKPLTADRVWTPLYGGGVLHTKKSLAPITWRKSGRVAVVGDLFACHRDDTLRAFLVMAQRPDCTFLLRTTQAEHMRVRVADWLKPAMTLARRLQAPAVWPLPNVWLGVSVEDQATADARIPLLLQTPAAVRFISAEPLLAQINLRDVDGWLDALASGPPRLSWVIAGGESGPKARPCDVAWIRSIVQQCQAAGVPAFVKQLGTNPRWAGADVSPIAPARGKCADPAEWPADLRVRQFPEAR